MLSSSGPWNHSTRIGASLWLEYFASEYIERSEIAAAKGERSSATSIAKALSPPPPQTLFQVLVEEPLALFHRSSMKLWLQPKRATNVLHTSE